MRHGRIILRSGREKPVRNRHPWVFSGAIDRIEGDPKPGDIVDIAAGDGEFLARGYWNPRSQIQARILSWFDEPIDEEWWSRMLRRAIEARAPRSGREYACRLVNAENDFLPGLVVDRYGDWLVLQALTLGIDQRKTQIAAALASLLSARGIYERSDVDVRQKEGLQPVSGLLRGEEPPPLIAIEEDGIKLLVDIRHGHKTGLYLDQRQNRSLLANLIKAENGFNAPRVLNLFSYTGGFGLHALAAGAGSVTHADASREALSLAEQATALNNLPSDRSEFVQVDVFQLVRHYAQQGEQFDIIICDPPKFAHSAGQIDRATRGYRDLNLHCFRLLRPGGLLMTFSCSGAIDADLFQKVVFGALIDSMPTGAGRDAQILCHLGPASDHPTALTFPEGHYLKGLLLRVY
ncbi:MAG: class I SAM-dependent rRNA methyltransferase [Aggregatilineales bacterium]